MAGEDQVTPGTDLTASDGLPRRLTATTATAAVVGVMVGSGILRVPTTVAGLVADPALIMALWVVGGLLSLALALLLAELGAMFPAAGGMYVFLREAFGERLAFVYGWTFLLVNPAAWATLAILAAEYVAGFFHGGDTPRRLIAIGLILAVSTANWHSTRLGARLQAWTTAAKLAALTGVVAAVALAGHRTASTQGGMSDGSQASGLLLALVAVLWAYEGVSGFCALAGEVQDPARNIPRALVGGTSIAMGLFLAVNAALLSIFPASTIARTPLAIAAAMDQVIGPAAAAAVAILVIVAALGSLVGCALSDPRVFFAMGRGGHLFEVIGTVQAVRLTPAAAIALHAVLACMYASSRTFDQLAATFVLGFMPFSALAAVGLLRLRRSRPEMPRPFRTPAAPLLAAVWVLVPVVLVSQALIETPAIAGLNIAIGLAGIPAFEAWQRWRRPPAPVVNR